MKNRQYLMEGPDEIQHLENANVEDIIKQARWGGIKSGMRVVDVGCGIGKTTYYLYDLVQPGGNVVGLDFSAERLKYAKDNYCEEGIEYILGDINKPLDYLGSFDFVWARFILEYNRSNSFEIVKNLNNILKPGGILYLIDLDYNCLSHYEVPEKLEKTLLGLTDSILNNTNFDPFAGRKLYSYLYDLSYKNIEVNITPHHLIFGELSKRDRFNWLNKIEMARKMSFYSFDEYNGDYNTFINDFLDFFSNPRRFSYTPLILCRGIKP